MAPLGKLALVLAAVLVPVNAAPVPKSVAGAELELADRTPRFVSAGDQPGLPSRERKSSGMTCRRQSLPSDEGIAYKTVKGPIHREECEQACTEEPECNAIAWERNGNHCFLKHGFDVLSAEWGAVAHEREYDFCYSAEPRGWLSHYYQFTQGSTTPSRSSLLERQPAVTRVDPELGLGSTDSPWAGLDFSDHFASYHVTYYVAPQTGQYTFSTSSDDGSMLYIDDATVVNNDGLHGMETETGTKTLTAGRSYKIEVTFFEGTGGAGLEVQVEGPGVSKRHLAGAPLPIAAAGQWLDLSGRPTMQSSTGWGGSAARAVDGNSNPNWAANSCTHTQKDSSPWWQVELGENTWVESVRVTNRDCSSCGDRLNGLQVTVDGQLCASGVTFNQGETKEITCAAPVRGAIVRLEIPGRHEHLTLCEVGVKAASPYARAAIQTDGDGEEYECNEDNVGLTVLAGDAPSGAGRPFICQRIHVPPPPPAPGAQGVRQLATIFGDEESIPEGMAEMMLMLDMTVPEMEAAADQSFLRRYGVENPVSGMFSSVLDGTFSERIAGATVAASHAPVELLDRPVAELIDETVSGILSSMPGLKDGAAFLDLDFRARRSDSGASGAAASLPRTRNARGVRNGLRKRSQAKVKSNKRQFKQSDYEAIKRWTSVLLARDGSEVSYCKKYSVNSCPAEYTEERSSRCLVSTEHSSSHCNAICAMKVPGDEDSGDACATNGCRLHDHFINFGEQSCRRNPNLNYTCPDGGCAASEAVCWKTTFDQITAIIDMVLALVPTPHKLFQKLKQSVEQVTKAAKGLARAAKWIGARKVAKMMIKRSARYVKEKLTDKLKEFAKSQAEEHFDRQLGALLRDPEAFTAGVADAVETFTLTKMTKEFDAETMVVDFLKALDPTGITAVFDVIEAFTHESCETADPRPPALSVNPDGPEFDYRWVPICASSFSEHAAKQICNDAGYNHGSVARNVPSIGEDAFYARSCAEGEKIGECTGDPGTGELFSPGSYFDPSQVEDFAELNEWYGKMSSNIPLLREDVESGGAAPNSIGEGNCNALDASGVALRCWD